MLGRMFKSQPQYTIRMLLASAFNEEGEISLKSFRHFTLGCTLNDESVAVTKTFNELSDFFKGPVSCKVQSIINLGTEAEPLWGIKLSLDSEETIRNKFSSLFDSLMCPEKNGTLYLWNSENEPSKRCVHITLGERIEDKEAAQKLLDFNYTLLFERLDYKRVGPYDPIVTVFLGSRSLELEAPAQGLNIGA